ncbi:hypothetical protein BJF87_21240 [Gordonia sp. CNJ-863]|uniref:hypothetical protein n=1 Tax=Gordonia sp. CNJ-863 TaxID=1904963 RepID=UPI00096074CE|nr:hypothetical protein [Gordonia sp. CNJ-863]OLT47742.1 hypothetical protein BJF87_21240 [Gordonia sp. CNJ-863]
MGNWWKSIVVVVAVMATSLALAVTVPSQARADSVASYTSDGSVKFTSKSGGFLSVSASGLRPTGNFNGQTYGAECLFTGQSDNARNGEGFNFISGFVPVKANGTWSTKPFGPDDPNPIPNGDYVVTVTCTGQVPGSAQWLEMTSPSPVGLKIDGTGMSSNPDSGGVKVDWGKLLADVGSYLLCLGGFAILAFPAIVTFRIGGWTAMRKFFTDIERLPLFGGVASDTLEQCSAAWIDIPS